MVVIGTKGQDVVLFREGAQPCGLNSKFNLHALAPIILGLMAPFVVIALLAPEALAHIQFMVTVLMVGAMIACIFIFIRSVLSPGPVTSVRIDPRKKRLIVERCGPFATTVREIRFIEIVALKMVHEFDQDGYGIIEPRIVLRSRETLAMPEGTTEEHLEALRPYIGLE